MDKVRPCLWFNGNALEAVQLYTSLIPNSGIEDVHHGHLDTPSGKAGGVLLVSFSLAGRGYQALNGGRHDQFNDAISLSVTCEDQAEVDRLWEALTANGGRPVMCGWLKDKYGLSWQIVPKQMLEMLATKDPEKGRRVMQAMMQMVKLDVAALQKAFNGA